MKQAIRPAIFRWRQTELELILCAGTFDIRSRSAMSKSCSVSAGGFRDPAHLVRRASQPHDSPRLGVRAPALALPRPWRRPAPRARRPRARLLPCHPAAQGVDVRSRDPDASDASRLGERANELERHLHGAGRALRIPCGGRTRSRCRPAHAHSPSRAVIVLVAARTQIGCLINSEWRKHRRPNQARDHPVPETFPRSRDLPARHDRFPRSPRDHPGRLNECLDI